MMRRKVEVALIGNPRKRAATFAKRKEGLRKKARELATLCGVPVALVVCTGGGAAEAWESEEGVLDRYRALPAEARAGHTHRRYLEDKLGKERAKLASRRQDGALAPWDAALNDMTLAEARELLGTIDAALRATSERREELGLPADGSDRRLEQTAPLGHGAAIQYIGSNTVTLGGHEMQMMPRDGTSDQHSPVAWDDSFQPRNACVMHQPEHGSHAQRGAGGSHTGNGGNVQNGWLNLSMWSADESCNAVAPVGYFPLNIGGNFGDTPADYLALRSGGDFISTPAGFHVRPTGSGGNFMNAHGYDAELGGGAPAFGQTDTDLDQLHYLRDVAEGMRYGARDTHKQPQPWG